jgi:hypothetical protein
VRARYLEALAVRTLGTAPVLRPSAPSRFEPESPQAELTEAGYTVDAAALAERAAGAEQRPAQAIEADRPLLGDYQPRSADEGRAQPPQDDNWPVRAARPDAQERLTEAQGQRERPTGPRSQWAPPFLAGSPGDTRSSSLSALAPHEAPGPDGELAPRATAAVAMPLQGPAMHHDDAAEQSHARQRGRDDWRDAAHQQPPKSEPAVVVHIGRVEVRAVHAQPPPAATPRPRSPAQPSLADYLLARDQGRR